MQRHMDPASNINEMINMHTWVCVIGMRSRKNANFKKNGNTFDVLLNPVCFNLHSSHLGFAFFSGEI